MVKALSKRSHRLGAWIDNGIGTHNKPITRDNIWPVAVASAPEIEIPSSTKKSIASKAIKPIEINTISKPVKSDAFSRKRSLIGHWNCTLTRIGANWASGLIY
jgi:hypothetical protein